MAEIAEKRRENEQIQKMARIAMSWKMEQPKVKQSQERKTKSKWEFFGINLTEKNFPSLGLEKHQRQTGKYVQIKLENANIHEAHPVQMGMLLKQYFSGHSEQRKIKNALLIKTRDMKQFETVGNLKNDIYVTVNGNREKVIIDEIVARNQSRGIVFDKSWNQLTAAEIQTELQNQGYKVKEVRQMTRKEGK